LVTPCLPLECGWSGRHRGIVFLFVVTHSRSVAGTVESGLYGEVPTSTRWHGRAADAPRRGSARRLPLAGAVPRPSRARRPGLRPGRAGAVHPSVALTARARPARRPARRTARRLRRDPGRDA